MIRAAWIKYRYSLPVEDTRRRFAPDSHLARASHSPVGRPLLLTGFTAYFVLWHSAGHLRELQSFLELPSWWSVIRKGIPMTVVALAGIVVFWLWIGSSLLPSHWILYGFVAISLLTLPHMILVDRMLTYSALSLRKHE
jgi:hypothetical protein